MSGKPDGTEDKAQLRALGEYFERKARGEIRDTPLQKPPGFTWGFAPETRARLLAEREARAAQEQRKGAPGGGKPAPGSPEP